MSPRRQEGGAAFFLKISGEGGLQERGGGRGAGRVSAWNLGGRANILLRAEIPIKRMYMKAFTRLSMKITTKAASLCRSVRGVPMETTTRVFVELLEMHQILSVYLSIYILFFFFYYLSIHLAINVSSTHTHTNMYTLAA